MRRIRKLYLSRRDCLIGELRRHFGNVKVSGVNGGMHILWHLPPGFPPACELQQMALEAGVGIYCMDDGGAREFPGSDYGASTIMLGYSSVTEEAIRLGIARIADMLGEWQEIPLHRTAIPESTVSLAGFSNQPSATPPVK